MPAPQWLSANRTFFDALSPKQVADQGAVHAYCWNESSRATPGSPNVHPPML